MKYILITIITLYWKFVPESRRRKCLFKRSCSKYVYDILKKEGFSQGIRALLFRIRNCNPKYFILTINNEKVLVSATNRVFKLEELNETLFIKNSR